jgi:hypothetical protein
MTGSWTRLQCGASQFVLLAECRDHHQMEDEVVWHVACMGDEMYINFGQKS